MSVESTCEASEAGGGVEGSVPRHRGFGPDADDALVTRALGGDRWAEEALFRRHVADVLGLATRLLGDRDDADDVTQEAFLHAFRRLGELRDRDAFGRWLRRIVVHRARQRSRRTRFRRLLLSRSMPEGGFRSLAVPEAPPDVRAELAEIDRVLGRVGVGARTAWCLARVEGWTLPEVADALDVSLSTAKRWVRRVDGRLRPGTPGSAR